MMCSSPLICSACCVNIIGISCVRVSSFRANAIATFAAAAPPLGRCAGATFVSSTADVIVLTSGCVLRKNSRIVVSDVPDLGVVLMYPSGSGGNTRVSTRSTSFDAVLDA